MKIDSESVKAGVREAMDFWLSQHPVSLGDLFKEAIKEAAAEHLTASEPFNHAHSASYDYKPEARDSSEASDLVKAGNAAIGLDMLKGAMRFHPDFAWTWHCNIACAAKDEGIDHEASNRIAARFMKLAFDVEPTYPPEQPQAAEPIPTASEAKPVCVRCGYSEKYSVSSPFVCSKNKGGSHLWDIQYDKPLDSTADEAKVYECTYCHQTAKGDEYGDGLCSKRSYRPHDWQPPPATTEHEAKPANEANDYPPPASGGKGWQRAGDTLYATPENAQPPADATALSLLIIDLGDSCVVKVESVPKSFDTDNLYSALNTSPIFIKPYRLAVSQKSFTDIRAAMDAFDKPPVPRIEEWGEGYWRIYHKQGSELIDNDSMNTLNKLAGKPLPIWSGGTWTEIGHIDDEVYRNSEIRVWLYTK